MFDWLGDLISGIGDAIGGAFDYIGESIANTIFNSILQWLYEIIYGAISDFFEMIGNMGAEIFDLSWVQATVRLFTLFGWSLFAVGTVVAIFDVAIEYQNGRANIKTACINIRLGAVDGRRSENAAPRIRQCTRLFHCGSGYAVGFPL